MAGRADAGDARRRLRSRVKAGVLQLSPDIRAAAARLDAERAGLAATRARVAARDAELGHRLEEIAAGAAPRPDLRYLFVVTYGRSGSTLLQGLLDSIPGFLIRGENDNAVFRLYQYESQLRRAKSRWTRDAPLPAHDAWYGIDGYPVDAGIAGLRSLLLTTLLRPEADTRVTGFKEIRWWVNEWAPYLDFLQQVFPGARFVINVRDLAAVSRSRWWAENPDALARLAGYEERLTAIAERLGPLAYRTNFDEFVADHGVLEGLFDWLGEPFDRALVDETMAVRHSS